MTKLMTRRTAVMGALLAAPALHLAPARLLALPADAKSQLEALEKRHGGRLGVAVVDLETGNRLGQRADERFALCSTFKFIAAALALARVDRKEEELDREVRISKADLVAYSPAAEKRVGATMTVRELCEAAVTLSDNAAANLLLASFGGPAGLTAYCRSLGDTVTRLDRTEPGLNEAKTGDPRDTTSPSAMIQLMRRLLLEDALSPASRELITAWLVGNKTGDTRLRAGVPKGWRVGDKTGTGRNGANNDVAIIWPPGRRPILVASYYAEALKASNEQRNAVHAQVGAVACAT